MKMKLNKKSLLIILILAFFVQLVIISYNYLKGYITILDFENFLIRILIGTSFSFIFASILVLLDFQLINYLDRILQLPKRIFVRIPAEFFLSIIVAVFIGSSVTLLSNSLMPYEDGLKINLINNSLITIVLNIIAVTIIESVLWFKRSQQILFKAERLEKENSQIKYETLKSQLNPHFLFNSLNVLSSLIKIDQLKAQKFVDEFSSVFRFTLDVIDKPVVEIKDEIDFAKSFLYLQKIRFEDAIFVEINIDAKKLSFYLPPLTIQTLLENTFKHNKATKEFPLKIRIFNEENFLFVTNNLQPKIRVDDSKGIGLSNLNKRYELIGVSKPIYTVTEKEYIAKIPIIIPE